MKKFIYLILLILPQAVFAQDSIRLMFYNLCRFPSNAPANREYLLEQILKEAQPDLFMASEIISKDGADRILNTSFRLLPDSFAAPQFVYCINAGDDPLQQMAYYNKRKLTLIHQEALHTILRDINHYTFFVNKKNPSGDTIFLDAFVTHLKAGEGSSDSWLRGTMADTFVKALHKIPTNHHVVLAGDFNFYNDQEVAYQIFTDTANPVVMIDPLHQPGNWHDNQNFKDIHTQATRKTLSGFGLGGAAGGMNDRFDFILISKNLETDSSLYYLPGSYLAFGNNGDCFDKAVNNDICAGIYSLSLRNLLFQMSDHLPVMLALITPNKFPTPTEIKEAAIPAGKNLFFPNGNITSGSLKIGLKGNPDGQGRFISIYDLTGRVLKIIHFDPTQKVRNINIGDWASGMYFARFRQETKRFVKR